MDQTQVYTDEDIEDALNSLLGEINMAGLAEFIISSSQPSPIPSPLPSRGLYKIKKVRYPAQ